MHAYLTLGGSLPDARRLAAVGGLLACFGRRVAPVSSASEVDALLAAGSARRHTHAMLMNASSSRSHLVLTLYATCTSERDGAEMRGRLHLVDLAGSERVGKSGAGWGATPMTLLDPPTMAPSDPARDTIGLAHDPNVNDHCIRGATR